MKKTNMKKYVISLGSVAMLAMPVVAAVSCSTTDSPYKPGANGVNLNNISGTLAHQLFRSGSLKVGDKINLTINGKTYVTEWTQENANEELSASTPETLFEILIQDFLALPDAPARADIVAALGKDALNPGHHGSTLSSTAPAIGTDFTGMAGDRGPWHTLFRYEPEKNFGGSNAVAGTKISLTLSDDTQIVYTWTTDDVRNEALLGPNELVEYVAEKFAYQLGIDTAHKQLDQMVQGRHGLELKVADETKAEFIAIVEKTQLDRIDEVKYAMGINVPTLEKTLTVKIGTQSFIHVWTEEDVENTKAFDYAELLNYIKNSSWSIKEGERTRSASSTELVAIKAQIDSMGLTGLMAGGHHSTSANGDGSQAHPYNLAGGNATFWHNLFRIGTGYLYDTYTPASKNPATPATLTNGRWISLTLPTGKTTTAAITPFQWTVEDQANEAKLNQDDLFDYLSARVLGVSSADAFAWAKTGTAIPGAASTLDADLKTVRESMKVDTGGHHNIGTKISSGVYETDYAFDFTDSANNREVWHSAFRTDSSRGFGPKNVGAGSVIMLRVSGTEIYYTWTAEDASREALMGPSELLDYVATRFASVAPTGFTLEQIKEAMGEVEGSHHAYPEYAIEFGHNGEKIWDLTASLKRNALVNDGSVTDIPDNAISANTTLWHDMFRIELIKVGDVVKVVVGGTRTATAGSEAETTVITGGTPHQFTWTARDMYLEDSLNQDDLFDYLSARLLGATEDESFAYARTGTTTFAKAITQQELDDVRHEFAVDGGGHHNVG